MKVAGWIVIALGAIVMLAGFVIDPSVSTSGGAVNNIGLLNTKSNLVMAGGAAAIVGAVLALIGEVQELAVQGLQRSAVPNEARIKDSESRTLSDSTQYTTDRDAQFEAPDHKDLDRMMMVVLGGIGAAVVFTAIYAFLF